MGLPTLWKFWKRNRPTHNRRVHLGIDYGVSTSKIVFRDCDAPGGGSSVLLQHNGSSRIPSRVCMTATDLCFGDDTEVATACSLYESVKTRVVAEVSGNPQYDFGWTTKLPDGFRAADLAALHPHICVLHDIGHQDGVDFLVMECVEGETLAKRLEKGPLPMEQVLKFGAQIADALDKAHRSGVVTFAITVKEFAVPPPGQRLRFYAEAEKAVNQKTAPLVPCGWGASIFSALGDCVRLIRQFPYEGEERTPS